MIELIEELRAGEDQGALSLAVFLTSDIRK